MRRSVSAKAAALLLGLATVPAPAGVFAAAASRVVSRRTEHGVITAATGSTSERLARAEGGGSRSAGAPRPAGGDDSMVAMGVMSHEAMLDNGLRLIVEERPATETIALRLVLLGGVLEAPENRSALPELHSSLLVRSTEDHKAEDLARAVETLGGRVSSGASLRSETITFDGPAESLEPALKLLAEMLLRPRFDPYELEKEKGLLVGSLASSYDEPGADLIDETYKTVFPAHPFKRLVRASDADVRAVTIDDVRRFHAARFERGRLALVVVGHCTHDDVARIALTAFTPLTWTDLPRVGRRYTQDELGVSDELRAALYDHDARDRLNAGTPSPRSSAGALPDGSTPIPSPAPLAVDVRRSVHRRTTQAEIMIALPMDGISDDDVPVYALLRHILGGFQERLYTEIREKRGFAYWVALRGFTMPTAGWIGIHTGANKKNLPEIERVVRAELARIVKEPVSADELDRARRYMTTAEARSDETNAGRAGYLTGILLDGRPQRTYEENVARLAAVTPEQIQALARRLFAGRHVAVVTLP